MDSALSRRRFVVTAGALAVLLAAVADIVILVVQWLVTPWRRAVAT